MCCCCRPVHRPCRFETLRPSALPAKALLLLDVAHNAPAIDALVASITVAYPSAHAVIIFGANYDKDAKSIMQTLQRVPNLLGGVAVQSSHPKAVPATDLLAIGSSLSTTAATVPWVGATSMDHALEHALQLAAGTIVTASSAGPDAAAAAECVVICCGSVFVAADMREAVAAKEPSLFSADDWVFEQANEPPLLM